MSISLAFEALRELELGCVLFYGVQPAVEIQALPYAVACGVFIVGEEDEGVVSCHRVEFCGCSQGPQLDDGYSISVANFACDRIEVVRAGVNLVRADAMNYDAEFGL